jgi:hypothetical protein
VNNFQWLKSMPLPVLAQWLCDINKCDTCFFKDKKEEGAPGKCTWYWLNEELPNEDELMVQKETINERPS